MEEKVNVRQALRAFNHIVNHGEQRDGGYHLNGLTAYTELDGYTAVIENDYVTLQIFFHNKFSFTFSNRKEKLQFLQKLSLMDA